MGVVQIPPDPVSGGSLSINIELSAAELQISAALMRTAVDSVLGSRAHGAADPSISKPPPSREAPASRAEYAVVGPSSSDAGPAALNVQALDAEVSNIAMRFSAASVHETDPAAAKPPSAASPPPQPFRTPDPASTGTRPAPPRTQPPRAPPPQPSPTAPPPSLQPPTPAAPRAAYLTAPSQPPPASNPPPHPRVRPNYPPPNAPTPLANPPAHPGSSMVPPSARPAPSYPAPVPRPQQFAHPPPHQPPPVAYPHQAPAGPYPSSRRPSAAAAPSHPAPSTRSMAAGHRVEVRAPTWVNCYTTDAGDHNGDVVQTMAYCPEFESLPGGDGHGGWLISSSRHMLNLWECSKGGSFKGQPSLMLMHSQMTDFLTTHMALEASSQQMFGASQDTRQGSECVSVHSLSAATGFLSYRYRYLLGEASPRGRSGNLLQQVVSLHGLGGQMRHCCAASYDGQVYIFEAAAHSATAQKPRAEWKAHDSPVTVLHRSPFGPIMFTGAQDGAIHMWSLKERPVHPLKKLGHQQAVTGIQQCNNHTLATSGLDSKVLLWDLRMPAAPVHTTNPDGTAVLKLAVSPVGDCVAAATMRGLCCVDLMDLSGAVTKVTEKPLPKPFTGIQWNERTGELYACGPAGLMMVFRQRY